LGKGLPWGVKGGELLHMVEEMFAERARGPEIDIALALCLVDFMEDAATIVFSDSDELGSPEYNV
jgi:hypothetical protein